MAYKKKYALVAAAGICMASGLAWWLQHKPANLASPSAAPSAPAGAAGGQRVPAVEVAKVQAVDPLIDANGRSVGIRGCIDNRQRQLRPGMFARVNTVFGVREQALTVPEEAIVPQGGRAFVLKVVPGDKPDTLVTQRVAVKTGVRQPGKVEITEGLEEGDTVVTAGQQRLQKDGTPVRVVDLAAAGKGPNAAASAPAAAASSSAASASATAAPASAAAAPADKAPALKAAPAASAAVLSGPNPCQRG